MRRYHRQDEIGTPLCVIDDFETIEQDNRVRDRDSMDQVRLPIDELEAYISDIVDFQRWSAFDEPSLRDGLFRTHPVPAGR